MTLLHIDSSLRTEGSVSRQLSAAFAAAWQRKYPEGRIIYRDFAVDPLPHLTAAYVSASYKKDGRTAEEQASAQPADAAVAELMSVDHILIGAPMYNFSAPSSVKTWVDHIVQDQTTFRFGPQGPEGLVKGKRVCAVTSHGGDYSEGSPWAAADMLTPWLRNILGFLGMTDFSAISVQATDFSPEQKAERIAKALSEIEATLAAW